MASNTRGTHEITSPPRFLFTTCRAPISKHIYNIQAEYRVLRQLASGSQQHTTGIHSPITSTSEPHSPETGDGCNGKGKGKLRRRRSTAVPSGTSINWISGLGAASGGGDGAGLRLGASGWENGSIDAEVTLSATGRMQGATCRGVLNLRMRCMCNLVSVPQFSVLH